MSVDKVVMIYLADNEFSVRRFRRSLKKCFDLADAGVHIKIRRGRKVYTLKSVDLEVPKWEDPLANEVFEDVVREPVYE